jgi:hypothetical protein
MKTQEVEIKILKIARRALRILRRLFPPSGFSGDRIIDRAYWAAGHRRNELDRRKREARRLLRMLPKAPAK